MSTRKRSPAIGIDLGTTYSCVGVWSNESNRVEIVSNEQGNPITPSYVAYDDHEPVLVGEGAKNQSFINPTNTIFAVKRIMGATFGDPSLQEDIKNWPFRVVEGPNNKLMVEVEHQGVNRNISPVEIASLILKNLKGSAESHLNMTVTDAIITVPAYFNEKQRRATMDAGIMAGLNVLRLINEPTAAAIAYSLDKYHPNERNIFIFDFGGGTLDLSILGIKDGNISVKAVGGDTHLGGEDLDNAMVDYCVKEFRKQYNEDASASERALVRLKSACETAKKALSSTSKAAIAIDCLFGGKDFKMDITRAKFEELNSRFFKECLDHVASCLQHGNMSSKQLDEVVLVGGSSRIPKLQQMLSDVFPGKPFCKSVKADQVVAQGAAILAAKLTEDESSIGREIVVVDVTPLSLGIRVMNGRMSVVVPRNTPIPTLMERRFLTRYKNQTKLTVRVYQGECDEANDNIFVGAFTLNDIPPGPVGRGVIVTFSLDVNGILEVKAELESTSKKRSMQFMGTGNLLKEDVERMLKKVKK